MPHIVNLPDVVMDEIFQHLVKIDLPPHAPSLSWAGQLLTRSKRAERAHVITQLRLVCRRWADWLYSNHLYDVIYIGSNQSQSHHQASAFVEEFTRRSITIPPPRCRYLKVVGLWTLGRLSHNEMHTKVEAQHLEDLVRLFANTIVTLDIQVVNFFTLPKTTIEQIGRIPNLQMLRLGIQFTKAGAAQLTAISSNPRKIPAPLSTDSNCLVTLLRAATGVVYLDMTDFRPVCPLETLGENLGDFQFTEIQALKLDVKLASNLTIDEVVRLSKMLPNLKALSIGGDGHDGWHLRPLFESLREQLEEIIVNDARIIRPMLNLIFPKLRRFGVHDWDRSFCSFLSQGHNMFSKSYTSLEVLALHSVPFGKRKPAAIDIPFDRLHLQRLELHYTPNHAPPRNYERFCVEYGVKCLYIEDADSEYYAQSNDHILASSLARITL